MCGRIGIHNFMKGLSCPDEVVVKYPDGVHIVVRRSDFHTSEFAKDDDPSSKGKNRPEPLDPIAIAVAALSIPKNMSHIQRARAYSPYPSLGN
ncbi:PREDICTED: LOC109949123 [Prunus dulcis]|uniref:PREDICTED: LOC109949123 n=1 Tax=Prunus dulcis TaxID=3755 RepID=A0A5E4F233_PRUDU|nr:PREDICTED: LOC109949123 [Prunus dulcis]